MLEYGLCSIQPDTTTAMPHTQLSLIILIWLGFVLPYTAIAADKGLTTDRCYPDYCVSQNNGTKTNPQDIQLDFMWSQPNGDGRSYPLLPNSRLPSGTKFTLKITTPRAGYLYVLHQDTQQQRNELFQLSGQPHEMQAGETRELPAKSSTFELDQQTGIETFYLIVSPTPLSNPHILPLQSSPYKGIRLAPNHSTIAGDRLRCTQRHPYCVTQFRINHD